MSVCLQKERGFLMLMKPEKKTKKETREKKKNQFFLLKTLHIDQTT